MKIFLTGASGFIGQALIPELLSHGHEVLGLARSAAAATKIAQSGAQVLSGNLTDPESLRRGATDSDATVHLAFHHDFTSPEAYLTSTEIDRGAIQVLVEAMAGTGKGLVIASGTLVTRQGRLATEEDEVERTGPLAERARSADLALALSREMGVRGMVVRFSPTVHDEGDWGLITLLGEAGKRNGFVTYIGEGTARWSAVHRADAAALVRLAVEKGRAGATYNAVAEEGLPMKVITTAIGEKLQLPVESKTAGEALPLLGFFAHVINLDNPTSSKKTQEELGWKPEGLNLLEDIKVNYFE